MHATVRRYEGLSDPGEVVRLVNEGFLPIIREIEGFVDYYVIDGGDGWRVRGAASYSLDTKPAPHHGR
jgi:hypothetical protein